VFKIINQNNNSFSQKLFMHVPLQRRGWRMKHVEKEASCGKRKTPGG
jgi:hypothetical protein